MCRLLFREKLVTGGFVYFNMAPSKKKYWIAEIVVEGEIQVRPVPSSWFKNEEGSDVCYWPLKQCGNDEINV